MQETEYFEPSFDSVAKPQDASAKVAEDVVEAEDETTMAVASAVVDEGGELRSLDAAARRKARPSWAWKKNVMIILWRKCSPCRKA